MKKLGFLSVLWVVAVLAGCVNHTADQAPAASAPAASAHHDYKGEMN